MTTSHIDPVLRQIKDVPQHVPIAVVHRNSSEEAIQPRPNFTQEQAELVVGMVKGLREARNLELLSGMVADLGYICTYIKPTMPIRHKPTGEQS